MTGSRRSCGPIRSGTFSFVCKRTDGGSSGRGIAEGIGDTRCSPIGAINRPISPMGRHWRNWPVAKVRRLCYGRATGEVDGYKALATDDELQ